MEQREVDDISHRHMMKAIDSPVIDFYNNTTIFITGATGFMGQILIEKLLRTCPGVKKIYLLARVKKNKDIAKRFEEQFSDVIYEKLRAEQPNFTSKLSYISGDLGQIKFGMNDVDYELICREVNVIFHMAATVRFDERLKLAIDINVRGTREMFRIAKECSALKAFLHVSTAYSNCIVNDIEEKFYDPPMAFEKLMELNEVLDDETLHKITPILIGKFPNTYAFTKNVAEDIVKKMSKGLPVAMIRPSIIVATAKEPIDGWIGNIYGPTGILLSAGLGLLHTLYCDPEVLADIIPVDYLINACLVATYEIAKVHEISKEGNLITIEPTTDKLELEVPIYNYVSSDKKPIKWKTFKNYSIKHGSKIPTVLSVWTLSFTLNKNYFIHILYVIFTHYIPAYIYDTVAYCIGKKPQLVKAYDKIHKFSDVITYFCTQHWHFHTQNVQNLCKTITPVEKSLFNFDISTLNWDEYFMSYTRGLRVYFVKDPIDTVKKAKRRDNLIKIAHYSLITLVNLGFLKLIWMLLKLFRRIIPQRFIKIILNV